MFKRHLIPALILLSAPQAFDLPDCPADQSQYYDNCVGSKTSPDGDEYVGEWKDDKYHGKGTYTSSLLQKGLEINVEEASNQQIVYTVISDGLPE